MSCLLDLCRRAFGSLCLLAAAHAACCADEQAAVDSPASAGLLRLAGGDELPGEWIDSDQPGAIRWQSPIAAEPFEIATEHVLSLQMPSATATASAAPQALELDQGDVLLGRLMRLTPEFAEFRSASLGDLQIARDRLRRLSAWGEAAQAAYLGPHGSDGWNLDDPNRWRDEGGHLLAPQHAVGELPRCRIPTQAMVEVEMSWPRKADFCLQFGVHSGAGPADLSQMVQQVAKAFNKARGVNQVAQLEAAPRADQAWFQLETFSGWLVLVREQRAAADLASLQKIDRGAGRLHLHLYFDRERGEVTAYAPSGELLGRVQTPAAGRLTPFGVRLATFSGEVRIERLSVRSWNGVAPPATDDRRPYLITTSGELQAADAVEFDEGAQAFRLLGSAAEGTAPTESVTPLSSAAIVNFGQGDPQANPPGAAAGDVRVLLADGQRLSGRVERVDAEALTLAREGLAAPARLQRTEIRSLVSLAPRVAQGPAAEAERIAELRSDQTKSRGQVVGVAVDGGVPTLVWQPLASRTASPLQSALSAELVYRDSDSSPASGPSAEPTREPGLLGQLFDLFTLPEGGAPVTAGGPRPQRERELLWLNAGDRIPCRLVSIDASGVHFTTSLAAATFLPHEQIRAWESDAGSPLPSLEVDRLQRLLTLPRMQRNNPPTHLVESSNGDLLRTRLTAVDDQHVTFEVRLEEKRVPRDQVERIIWLHPDAALRGKTDDAEGASTDEASTAPQAEDAHPLQAVQRDGICLTFVPAEFAEGALVGHSPALGECRVDLAQVERLRLGGALEDAAADHPYAPWRLKAAADPQYVAAAGDAVAPAPESASPLVGQSAPDFRLDTLGDAKFQLAEARGQVVVLDFWASWCGPCVQAMPQIEGVVEGFAGQGVRLVAVNMQEDAATVAAALERIGVAPEVALDIDGAAAGKYAVTAIPQTVVIDAAGVVRAVLVGGGPLLADNLNSAIRAALEPQSQSPAPAVPAAAAQP